MTTTLRFQLETQCNLVVGSDDEIVGYLGWILTSEAIAEAWVNSSGPLTALVENPSAAAVTVLATTDSKYVLPLIKRAKALNPDLPVYWKRQFADGKQPANRRVRKKPG
jgi:hypothetical protein